MPSVKEFGKEISITLGALAFVGAGIYQGTTIYNQLQASVADHDIFEDKVWSEFSLLEQRMEKRYKRGTDANEMQKKQLEKQDEEIITLEKAVLMLKEHINCIHAN